MRSTKWHTEPPHSGEVAEFGLTRTPGTRVDSKGSRGFESPPLRHRVPISGDTSLGSPKSPPQRPHLQICGRGEKSLSSSDGQFAPKISVGNSERPFEPGAERN